MNVKGFSFTPSKPIEEDISPEISVDQKKREELFELTQDILNRLIDEITVVPDKNDEAQIRIINGLIREKIAEALMAGRRHLSQSDKQILHESILDEIYGFGPITQLLDDPDISEIMVNGPDTVYVESEGKIKKSDVVFRDERHVYHTIDKIIAPLGRRVDESSPMVDARLPDGSRVNIIIPPLAINGPTITIRKFAADPFTLEDLITFGTLNVEVAKFLRASVRARMNIIVSGGTGSGKTTLLNVLSGFLPEEERIVTIEDAAELQLQQKHVISLESRPANIEGKGKVSIRDLVVNTLRMRPDRIIVGEVRSGETLDMLQAMNTGHDGSITTVHANSPRDSLYRLETMVLMSGMELPSRAIREQISSALHLIVQVSRYPDGTRKISKISEVMGMEGDTIVMQDIFVFQQEGLGVRGEILGHHVATGIVPSFIEKIRTSGEILQSSIFKAPQERRRGVEL